MSENPVLRLSFHGRIIDHLGIQMYQSPVAAVAELISNAWDADAEVVKVFLPESVDDGQLTVEDNGIGMTLQECQERFLNVGWCRRGDTPTTVSPEKKRPILGRKGIGKFAGFGIATLIRVDTVSKANGEKTVFELDINTLRGDNYAINGGDIAVLEYLPPDKDRAKQHGTSITLKNLTIARRPSPLQFAVSMARRFLLHQRAEDFRVYVNGNPLPEENLDGVEFSFPNDYREEELPELLLSTDENGWGTERLANGREIRWRVLFYRDTIEEEELRGIAVFCNGKLAQKPFFFNLSGGLGGQHGQEYMSGQIEATYIDQLAEDIIATERQRINWEHPETLPLEDWGQQRIKTLLRIWKKRRGERRRQEIEQRVATFSERLNKLPPYEQKTIKRALTSLGGVPTLTDAQFQSLGEAILQAWEQGRLRELIDAFATKEDVSTEWLLTALAEADVLVALNLAEAVRTKIEAIRGLRVLVEKRELENSLRDYIADKPYLLHPKWETFKKETSVRKIMLEAAEESGLQEEGDDGQRKRIDLALRSGDHLLIVEFMRPGKKADWDHLSRCRRYVHLIRHQVEAETALGIKNVTGLIVADRLDGDPSVKRETQELIKTDIYTYSWESLLDQAEQAWREFLAIVGSRAPNDERLCKIQE